MKLPAQSFFFIRHGETDYNAQHICTGQLDINLNEHGRLQARQAQKILANCKIDMIFHSSLKRARETAQIINQNKIEMFELKGTEERNCGDFQGLKKDNIKELRAKVGYYFLPNNAETDNEFESRIIKALLDTLNSNIEKNILFVSHGGVFKALLKILKIKNRDIENCDIFKFIAPTKDQNEWEIEEISNS